MTPAWTLASLTAPSLLGVLLHGVVELYAEVASEPLLDQPAVAIQPASVGGAKVSGVDGVDVGVATWSNPGPLNEKLDSFDAVTAMRHAGRVYLGFVSHSVEDPSLSRVAVLSSADEVSWRTEFEQTSAGTIHGPHLLLVGEELFAYLSVESEGRDDSRTPLSFYVKRGASGAWTAPTTLDLGDQLMSSVRTVGGRHLMTTYTGGSSVYHVDGDHRDVRMLMSADGVNWRPPLAGDVSMYRGGGSDSTVSSGDDGNLLAVVRNEAGDSSGWGASVCVAHAPQWSSWDCVNDPRNYGAATLFSHADQVYLVGERQLSDTGNYDQARGARWWRLLRNQAERLTTGKRCALYRFERAAKKFAFVVDLPSRGDTCSPAVIDGDGPGRYVVYAQSSDITGPDLPLQMAKQRPNRIYRYELTLEGEPSVRNAAWLQ